MPKALNPEKLRNGKVCEKHPDLNGLRFKASSTCIQCQRDASTARLRAAGVGPRTIMPPEEAKEKSRQKEVIRSQKRRQDPSYNLKQVERKRKWRLENSEHVRAVGRAYDAKQMAENIQRRLSKNLRHRLRKAMLGETRSVSAVRDLGMSISEFRAYIESKFSTGMSWGNYGKWHLDHIKPLHSFLLTDDVQAKAASHYSNIQPLWASVNQSKWCKQDWQPNQQQGVAL